MQVVTIDIFGIQAAVKMVAALVLEANMNTKIRHMFY